MSKSIYRFLAPPPEGRLTRDATPAFSVIIAAYQAADTIGEAIESALHQTIPPHEIVVCDDGSTDNTLAAVEPYRDRIVLLRKENGGAASARNAAVRAATGEFVVQLDSDDVFLPERLEALGALAAARPDLDILSTDAYLELEGEVVGRFYGDKTSFPVTRQRTAIFDWCFVGWPALRRRLVLELGGYDESFVTGEDWDLVIRLLLGGSRAGIVPEPLLRYRLRAGSLSADRTSLLRERVTLLDKTATNPQLDDSERRALARARRAKHSRALCAEARQALVARRPDARRRALAVARAGDCRLNTRALALAAACAPRVAGALIAARPAAALQDRRPSPTVADTAANAGSHTPDEEE
jgi:GT2 family glycosyltransferase